MKIVINKDFGGFGLSEKALIRYLQLKQIEYEVVKSERFSFFYHKGHVDDNDYLISEYDICRADPILVEVVEELGDAANSEYSDLKVVEIPDDVQWVLHEYDGIESIHEKHRVWS